MRVWDCDPSLLSVKHLGGEHNELHTLTNAVAKVRGERERRPDGRDGWLNHTETIRFLEAPWWLVLRAAFVRLEGGRRGLRFKSVPEFPKEWMDLAAMHAQLERHHSAADLQDGITWEQLTAAIGDYPMLDGGPWTPWKRDGLTYDEYTLTRGDR